jgi:hypothetical protein
MFAAAIFFISLTVEMGKANFVLKAVFKRFKMFEQNICCETDK